MLSMLELPTTPVSYSAAIRRTGGHERTLPSAARAGALERVRRGAYVDSDQWRNLSTRERWLMRMLVASHAAQHPLVFSHESAAIAWGIPVVEPMSERLHITVPPGSGLKSNRLVIRHEAPLARAEMCDLEAMLLTTVPRTLVDFVAARSFLSGMCAVEHVLSRGGLERSAFAEAIRRRRPFRGSRRAEAVAEHAGEHSESVAETLCRVRFLQLGYVQPRQQSVFEVAGASYRVDFHWPEYDVICEMDGRSKYEDARFLAGRTPQQALWEEKLREDELRARCRAFVRLTWDDAWNTAGLVRKLTRAGVPRSR